MRKPLYRRPWVYPLGMVLLLQAYLLLQSPEDTGPWKPEQARTANAELNGDRLTLHNIRDFRYDRRGAAVTEERYLTREYNLADLRRIWFGLSHFGPYGLAHSFLSFEFTDDDYLVLSVEARQRPAQHYNPVLGLLRHYTKIYVASTEQDVIGVRSHLRGERVLLYPVMDGDDNSTREFFLALLDDMNELHDEPAFYNTILDNCLTNLLKHSADFGEISSTDFRVLLPGHTDRLTYAFGSTPDDVPFETARTMATIDPDTTKIDAENFSEMIRCGWHNYASFTFTACDNPL